MNIFYFQWIQEKGTKTSSSISMEIIKNELILKTVPPLSGFYRPHLLLLFWYTLIIYIFFPKKDILSKNQQKLLFSHLIGFIYKIILRYHNMWKWKIILAFTFCPYTKIESLCVNRAYFSLATYCVLYLHTMAFWRNQIPYTLLKPQGV